MGKRLILITLLFSLTIFVSLGFTASALTQTLHVAQWIGPSSVLASGARPTVLYDPSDNLYKMWYKTSESASYIRYATSSDGITWDTSTNTNVAGTNDCPFVMKEGSTYYMFNYKDSGDQAFYVYTSTDGITWTVGNKVLSDVGSHITIPASGNTYGKIDNPKVINDGGTYKMYFQVKTLSGGSSSHYYIYLATSNTIDGTYTVANGGNPVLLPDASGWDDFRVMQPMVVKDGSDYYMWYVGYSSSDMTGKIGFAYSSDGVNWTKGHGNPILTGDVWKPSVLKVGDTWKIWYQKGSNIYYASATGPFQFSSIQNAINAAKDGDTVIVHDGTYNEQLTINTPITLMAGSNPVLDFSGYSNYGVDITVDNVIIDGFKIIGVPYSGSTSSANNPTIKAEANYVTVENCIFNSAIGTKGKEAMLAMPGINHINFLNNEVNSYIYGITARANGWGGSATLPNDGVTDLTVSGNTFNVAYADTGNQITGEAVQIWYGDNIAVKDNTINGPGTFKTSTYDLINSIGIADFMSGFGAAGKVTYDNNKITNCYVGIATFAGNGEISGNTINANNIGIQVGQNNDVYISTPAQGVVIKNNDITSNTRGIWIQNFVADGIGAYYNNIIGNTEYGVINEDPENDIFDATYNYWGHPSGPHHSSNPTGQGDRVSDNVDYSDWLGAPVVMGSLGPEQPFILSGQTVSNSDGSITVKAYGTGGTGEIHFFNYQGNPKEDSQIFSAGSNFFDIKFVSIPDKNDASKKITQLDITFQNPGGEAIFWWDKNANTWVRCSNQHMNPDGSITITVTDSTSPNLNDLQDPPFGGGTPLQVPVLSPALLVVLFGSLAFIGFFKFKK